MSVQFFYGDEEFLMETEINRLRDKLLNKEFASMNFKRVNCPNFVDFTDLLRTQPMMFGSQLIVINIENLFSVTLDDKQLDEIKNALASVSESLYIILTYKFERNSKKKPDSRKKIYKILSNAADLKEFASIPAYKTDELIRFINQEGKKHSITIERAAAVKLIEQVGNNLREVSKEIEKLALMAYPKNKVTEQMVKVICITNEDVFALTDKLFNGKKASALKEFRKLCDKQHPLGLLAVLQTNLRKVIIMKLNEKRLSTFEISKLVGYNEYFVQHRLEDLKKVSIKDLVRLKRNFANAELNIKTGNAVDVQSEIELAFY